MVISHSMEILFLFLFSKVSFEEKYSRPNYALLQCVVAEKRTCYKFFPPIKNDRQKLVRFTHRDRLISIDRFSRVNMYGIMFERAFLHQFHSEETDPRFNETKGYSCCRMLYRLPPTSRISTLQDCFLQDGDTEGHSYFERFTRIDNRYQLPLQVMKNISRLYQLQDVNHFYLYLYHASTITF